MHIDVFSDVVCPWCYIGERRLAAALAQRPGLRATRSWRPFQLQPEMPAEGIPWAEMVRSKFGGPERAGAMFRQVSAAGAPDGIRFEWERVATAPNTVDAHRLVLWAAGRGREWEMAEALFGAYFTEGRDLGSADDLADAAARAGLDPDEARALLAGDEGRDDVRRSQEEARSLGISGVPFFVIDGRWAVSGAQPVEVFLRALDEAAAAGGAP
jgi:predicted DsbA family dithiol-disulfide isomerase